MEHTVFLDIETIPCQNPEAIERIRKGITPPANIKKDDSKAKWFEENLEAATQDAVAKTSFNPALGHICTISWAVDDEEPDTAHARSVEEERDVLAAFFASIKPFHRTIIVGHNVGGFDIRFILCRAVVLGLPIPRALPRDPKPWDKTIFDTMMAWSGAKGTISMDNLCLALGLAGKEGFDGSMVAEAWANGEHDRIAEYCADDVRKTREVYRKFAAVGWAA